MNTTDFDEWNIKKQEINNKFVQIPFFKKRDIFCAQLGKNIGHEQNGKGKEFLRPIIVLRKFNPNIFLCIPLTSKLKENKYHFKFTVGSKVMMAILSQARLIDSKRLKRKMGEIDKENFKKLIRKSRKIFFNT